MRSPIFERVRRFVLWWTLLSLVLIGTGVVDWMHRIGHPCASASGASCSMEHACCSDTSACDAEASDCAPSDSGCSGDAHLADHDHDACGDHACASEHAACSSVSLASGADHGADNGNDHGAETSPAGHQDHSCPICLTLASLAAVAAALVDDPTPIARLVGVTMVAADIAPTPTPLEAVEARPPPACSILS